MCQYVGEDNIDLVIDLWVDIDPVIDLWVWWSFFVVVAYIHSHFLQNNMFVTGWVAALLMEAHDLGVIKASDESIAMAARGGRL